MKLAERKHYVRLCERSGRAVGVVELEACEAVVALPLAGVETLVRSAIVDLDEHRLIKLVQLVEIFSLIE